MGHGGSVLKIFNKNKYLHVILLAASVLMLGGCDKPPAAPPPPQARTEGESVIIPPGAQQTTGLKSLVINMQPVPPTHLNGRVVWNEDKTVRIYTPFAGRVERILVQAGEAVAKGQPVAVIASPDFGQAQSDARRAESDFALTEKNLARLRELEQAGVTPRKDLHAAEADQARAAAELARTRRRLELYGGGGRGVDQTYTLTSPIAGVVVEKNINPGQELRPDQAISNTPPLYTITDPATLWVQIDATERDLPLLTRGKTITIRTPAYAEENFPAQIASVADFLDPTTRTIKARATLANPSRKLKGEMYVTAEIDTSGATELLVPSKALYFQSEKNYVFIDEGGGKYTRRTVKAGDIRDSRTEILNGLKEGEKVVVDGALMLQQMLQPRRVQK
jgi:membrane fusion protein, heavy metal efflux system